MYIKLTVRVTRELLSAYHLVRVALLLQSDLYLSREHLDAVGIFLFIKDNIRCPAEETFPPSTGLPVVVNVHSAVRKYFPLSVLSETS